MPLSLLDISNALKNSNVCVKVPELAGGHAVMFNGNPVSSAGGYCVVYKYQLANGTYKALRIWHKDLSLLPDLPEVADKVSQELTSLKSDYFIDYKFYDRGILVNGNFYPLVVMDWCDGLDLKDYITDNINNPAKIHNIACQFKDMVSYFHKHSISHGDLQHGNIRIRPNGKLCVLDYDSMYVPALKGKREYIKGLPSFQHPTARELNEYLNPKVDFFSEYIIYLSLLIIAYNPGIWTEEIKKSDDLLLFDIDDLYKINTPQSILFKYRNISQDKINWIIRDLQSFMASDDLNSFKPLENMSPNFNFLPGDPKAHERDRSANSRSKTKFADVNVKSIIDSFTKGK